MKIDKCYHHKIFFNLICTPPPTGEKNVPRLRPHMHSVPRLCLGWRRYRRQAIGFIITSIGHRCSTCVLSQLTTPAGICAEGEHLLANYATKNYQTQSLNQAGV